MRNKLSLVVGLAIALAANLAWASKYAPEPISSGEIEPGVWNSSLSKGREYVKNHPGVPLIAVWSKRGCHMCEIFDSSYLTKEPYVTWQKESGAVFVYVNSSSWSNTPELEWIAGDSKDGCEPKMLADAPFVRVYWYDANGKKITDLRFTGRNSKIDGPAGEKPQNLINKLEGYLPGWQAKPSYAGGTFVATNVVGACMEVEPTTTTLNIPLTRTATTACSQEMSFTKKSGAKSLMATPPASFTITWSNETEQVYKIENFDAYYEEGATYEMSLTNAEGKVVSSTIVRCVPAQANSSMNPYWVTEKTAETLEWGDWTMDLEAASNKVANTEGACLVMYIGGELWCPWCKKGEDNFLSSKDFKDWTKEHKAVIAQIDCPKQHVSAPTLLSHEVNTSGIAPNGIASGSSYLTRKMADLDVAQELFERNYNIVSNAFRRPESSAWRTGMGTFILIDRQFRVVGRLEWKRGDADESKRTPEQLQADVASNMMRLNELYSLMGEENEESNQNWYTTKVEIPSIATVNGNTLSASDRIDTFRIPAASVGQTQTYSVKAAESANLTVKVIQVPAGSEPIVEGQERVLVTSGIKDAGAAAATVSLEIPDANCYLVVQGDAATTFKTDYQTANSNSTLRAYTLDSDAVLIPKAVRATAEGKPGSTTVQMKLEEGATYRIEGLDAAACASVLQPVADRDCFYTALQGGVQALTLSAAAGTVTYQKWSSGDVGFVTAARTVSESVCDADGKPLAIPVSRAGGLSGMVKVRVSVNTNETTLAAEDEAHPRFALETTELTWQEGESTNQYVSLLVHDYDDIYYGEGDIVLDLELLSDEGSVLREGYARYTLSVTEDDKRNPGSAMVTGGVPYFAKKQSVYVREGERAAFTVKRIDGSDGLVSVVLASSRSGVTFDADDPRDIEEKDGKTCFYWAHHETAEKPVYVSGVKAGETAKITLTAYNKSGTPAAEQFKVVSASNYVNVIGVAATAPTFENPTPEDWFVHRYVAASRCFKLKEAPQDEVKFVKTLGTLPAGLKASYDATENALLLSGAPTCKAGAYTVVYQAKDGAVAGLTCEITIRVADPTDPTGPVGYCNPSVAKARTIKDIPAYQRDDDLEKNVLVGTVQVTIPPKGNLSAKFAGAETLSFSAKSWSDFNPNKANPDGTLVAVLKSSKGHEMEVDVNVEGSVTIVITPPEQEEDESVIHAESDGAVWSASQTAEAWAGYYTVALPVVSAVESVAGTAPRGTGYLTLKMNTASAWKKGTFTVAGMLPNGTALTRSVALVAAKGGADFVDGEENVWGSLPVFVKSTTDVVSLPIAILKNAVAQRYDVPRSVKAACKVDVDAGATPFWRHVERDPLAGADYLTVLDVCGSVYDASVPLNQCCEEQSYPASQKLQFSVASLGKVNGGDVSGLSQPLTVTVGEDTLVADSAQLSAEKMTFKFDRSKGLASGTWKLPYTVDGVKKYVSATWKGVVLTGWGDCCQVGDSRPFVNGAFYFTEKRPYENNKEREVTVTLKRGGDCTVQ